MTHGANRKVAYFFENDVSKSQMFCQIFSLLSHSRDRHQTTGATKNELMMNRNKQARFVTPVL